jgi:hypothetical protein
MCCTSINVQYASCVAMDEFVGGILLAWCVFCCPVWFPGWISVAVLELRGGPRCCSSAGTWHPGPCLRVVPIPCLRVCSGRLVSPRSVHLHVFAVVVWPWSCSAVSVCVFTLDWRGARRVLRGTVCECLKSFAPQHMSSYAVVGAHRFFCTGAVRMVCVGSTRVFRPVVCGVCCAVWLAPCALLDVGVALFDLIIDW